MNFLSPLFNDRWPRGRSMRHHVCKNDLSKEGPMAPVIFRGLQVQHGHIVQEDEARPLSSPSEYSLSLMFFVESGNDELCQRKI